MITEIKGNTVYVTAYGFPPGQYKISDFSADELLEERRILTTYRNAHQITGNVFSNLDDQLARLIDQKCNEGGKA